MTSCRQRRRSPLGMVYPPRKRSPGGIKNQERSSPNYINRQSSNNYYYDGVGSPTKNFIDNLKNKTPPRRSTRLAAKADNLEIKNVETVKSPKKSVQSPVDKIVDKMDVMSCKDMRVFLDKNTQLTLEEKIMFLEQNSKGNRQLKSYIASQHWGIKEQTFYIKSGDFFKATFADKIKEAADFLIPEINETDPDCIYLNELLTQYRDEKSKNSVTGIMSGIRHYGGKAIHYGGKGLLEIVNLTGKSLYYLGAFINYFLQIGFNIWTWLMKDPKTAYFTLLSLKSLKNICCRFVGRLIKENDLIDLKQFESKASKKEEKSFLWDIGDHFCQTLAVKATSKGASEFLGKLAGPFAKGTVTVLTGFLPGGGFIAAGLNAVLDVALNETQEQIGFAAEQAIYMQNVNSAMGMLFEIINPNVCLKQMLESVNEVEKEYEASKKKNEAIENSVKQGNEEKDSKAVVLYKAEEPSKGWLWNDGKYYEVTKNNSRKKSRK